MYVDHVSSSSLNNPLIRPRKVLHMFPWTKLNGNHHQQQRPHNSSRYPNTFWGSVFEPINNSLYITKLEKIQHKLSNHLGNAVDGRNHAPVDVVYRYPSIHEALNIPGGAEFLPSTVCTLVHISWHSAFRGSKLTPPHVEDGLDVSG